MRQFYIASVMCVFAVTSAFSQTPVWDGTWVCEKGVMILQQDDNDVTGKLGKDGTFDGTVDGDKLTFKYKLGKESGQGTLKIDKDGQFSSGKFNNNFQQGTWKAWKKSESEDKKKTADFSGVWLSSLGTLILEQDGKEVKGSIGPEGWSSIKTGEVEGNRLDFDWIIRQFNGQGWLEQTADGKRIFGVMNPDTDPSPWLGIRPEGYHREVQPKAGEIVKGIADNGMLYNLRMPDGWKEGDQTDVVVLLHGSNWTTSGMVFITAKNWPEIGKKFAILGIQGQNWAKWSEADDLRFNYTYVNWVGRSTLGGFPYTHRESPFLVANLIDDFKKQYSFDRVFVGGHSQGGYLTYVLQMNYPEKLAGTFPIAGGVIIQAEPDVFDDEDLMRDQRNTPMYILHGKKDNVVNPSMGQYAYNRFLAHDFPRVKFSAPSRGHPYDFLPVDKAIHWLDMMSTEDKEALAKFGKQLAADKQWRDVGMVLERAEAIDGGSQFSSVWQAYQKAALKDAEKFLAQIKENKNGKWIDKYLEWEEQFTLSSKVEETIDAFRELREEQSEAADELYKEARAAFRNGKRDEGYAKYQEIVDKYYASRRYRTSKASLDKR